MSDRESVIQNIKHSAEAGEFYNRVEIHDPVLTEEEEREILRRYIDGRKSVSYRIKRGIAVAFAKVATRVLNRDTVIEGLETLPPHLDGCIVTSNHFSPEENTCIRRLTDTLGKRLCIASAVSNFAMQGFPGFLMNYADTLPVSAQARYLAREFPAVLSEKILGEKCAVLLYPEQEMWYHYRKPRPPKTGAYFFAAKLGVPVVSCFVEQRDTEKEESAEFFKTRHVVHVLGVLYPDPQKSVRENTEAMLRADFERKRAAYEAAYGKPLDFAFASDDIAGWRGHA